MGRPNHDFMGSTRHLYSGRRSTFYGCYATFYGHHMTFYGHHQDRNNHKNQTKHDKDLKNSLKQPQHMKVKAEEVLGSILM